MTSSPRSDAASTRPSLPPPARPEEGEPILDAAQIAEICAAEYGLDVAGVVPLGGEHASNARLRVGSGHLMFKALRAARGEPATRLIEQLRWQAGLVGAALSTEPPLPVSRPLPTASGHDLAVFDRGESVLAVQVSEWMPGELMSDAPVRPEGLRDLGATAGRLTLAFAPLPGPPVPNEHPWAFERMAESIAEALPAVADPVRRACAEAVAGRFEDRVLPALKGMPRSVAHQDLNDYNVLMSAGPGPQRVTGIIDFDDARIAPRIAEVAVAGAYAMLGQEDPVEALRCVLEGYRRIVALDDEEIGVIFEASVARLCVNATVWTARMESNRASYGRARMARTWPTVLALAALDPAAAARRLTRRG